MLKLIVLLCIALALAGCGSGGTSSKEDVPSTIQQDTVADSAAVDTVGFIGQ